MYREYLDMIGMSLFEFVCGFNGRFGYGCRD